MNFVDLAVKSIVVSVMGLVMIALTRKSSAAVRHLALALSLFSLCALPFLVPVLPAWHVPFIKVKAPAVAPPVTVLQADIPAASLSITKPLAAPSQMDPASAVTLVWASIATLLALRVVTRLNRLRKLERSLPMSSQPELQSIVNEYCRVHGRHMLLLEGESNEPPMTWGHSRPVLLLPSVAREWPAERLRSVMLHELAHVERCDWIVSIAGEVVCALFWFNPIVWVVRKRLEHESELAADDRVLSMGVPRTQYATHLLELLRDLNQFPKAAAVAVAMARPGRLDGRIAAILEERRSRRTARGGVSLALAATLASIVLAVGAAGPTIVRDEIQRGRTTVSESQLASPQGDFRTTSVGAGGKADKNEFSQHASTKHGGVVRENHPRKLAATSHVSREKQAGSGIVIDRLEEPGRVQAPSISTTGADRMVNAPVHASISVARATHDSNNGDSADVSQWIPTEEISNELKANSKEIQNALREARQEAAKAGVKIDVSGILDGALKAVSDGMKSANLTKEQSQAIIAQANEQLKKAAKELPRHTPKPDADPEN